MRKEDTITVNGIEIKVKELTVGEVRHWLMDMDVKEQKSPSEDFQETVNHVLDKGFVHNFALSDILRMTDLSPTKVEGFTPSELQHIFEKCGELNPDFFGLREKLIDFAQKNH